MKKGEIALVELPQIGGREQYGTRLSIIMAAPTPEILIIIPLTSNKSALRFPFTLLLQPSSANGLSEESIALIFQLRAVDKCRAAQKIGTLEKEKLKEIEKSIGKMLEFQE